MGGAIVEDKNVQTMSHLKNSLTDSARGYSVGFYSIALEGWRRGLTLKFINENRIKPLITYQLSSEKKSFRFNGAKGEKVTNEALNICKNKIQAKKYLLKANVPTPEGKWFNKTIKNEEIVNYANSIGYPLVIKPSDGARGEGVIANIEDKNKFVKALKYVREKLGYKSVIVEKHFEGEDYRVYVVGDEVAGITKRITANVIGDGESTVGELVKFKNNLRLKSPILNASLIKIDQDLKNMLEQQDYTLNSIPQKDEVVFLKSKSNISAGGDPVDVTDELSDTIKQVAVDGVKAIPGLTHAGIDLMVNEETGEATVIEINSQPSIRTHLFPMEGKARDIPSKLIDHYFPETKSKEKQYLLYFDIDSFWPAFRKNQIKEYRLPDLPAEKLTATKLFIKGHLENVNYGSWIRKQAYKYNLNGYVKFLGKNQIDVVLVGELASIETLKGMISSNTFEDAFISNIEEKVHSKPVKIGFEIQNVKLDVKLKEGYYPVRLEGISKLRRKQISKNKIRASANFKNRDKIKAIEEKKEIEKKYNKVITSTSWRITKPLRYIRRKLNRKN